MTAKKKKKCVKSSMHVQSCFFFFFFFFLLIDLFSLYNLFCHFRTVSLKFRPIHYLHIDHNAPCLPPKFFIAIVSNFSWVLQSSQEKSKTMIMHFFGGREGGGGGGRSKQDALWSMWKWWMHVHPRAYVCMIYKKAKGKFPREHHVVWIGKTKHTT